MLQPYTTFLFYQYLILLFTGYSALTIIYTTTVFGTTHSNAIGYRSASIYEDRAVWIYCIGVTLQLIERTKSLQMRYLATAKLELTDTVAIQLIQTTNIVCTILL